MRLRPLEDLPRSYWKVPYVGARFPGAASRRDFALGANCQLWAYCVLDRFGFSLPDFRSDDLWHDTTSTLRVEEPLPLDLVLFNLSEDPYGAHVGVWTGDGVAHLCEEVGRPVVWRQSEFDARERYAVRLAYKRPVARNATRLARR